MVGEIGPTSRRQPKAFSDRLMNSTPTASLLPPEKRVLSTLESDGSRRWLYPRLSRGSFWHARRWVAYGLIAIFTLLPIIQIHGKPAILLDIVHRHFTLFGFTFLPTDTFLLAIFMVSLILGVFLFTALFGRVWCGWACPQTVYMEFLVRPLERLCLGRTGKGGPPPANIPLWRTLSLYVLYLVACLFLAHTFLSYFVGVAQLRHWITSSPGEHPAAFAVMAATTGLMLFDFCYFREQTCVIACPYGRLQSALLDQDSLIISYDKARGEPRGKMKHGGKSLVSRQLSVVGPGPVTAGNPQLKIDNSRLTTDNPQLTTLGDCIDCSLCVKVCPTGIDIRDGLQLECIGCAQCIDVCNDVMAKVSRPLDLIGYSSQSRRAGKTNPLARPRVLIYAAVMLLLVTLLSYMIATKSPFDMSIMRNLGRPFVVTDDGRIGNEFRVELTNRSDKPLTFQLSVADHPEFSLHAADERITLTPGQMWAEPIEIRAPASVFALGAVDITLRAKADDGAVVDQPARLLGSFILSPAKSKPKD